MQRTLVSFLLLVCLILNQIGFFLFFQVQSLKNNWFWELNKFSGQEGLEEVQIELPIVFPYAYYQNEFETANTSVKIEDEFYRITKHKYSNDTLFLVFVKDSMKNKIHTLVQGWVESDGENNQPINSGKRTVLSKIVQESYLNSHSFLGIRLIISNNLESINFSNNPYFTQNQPGVTTPPPEKFLS
jgi:hypothetical protein